MTTASKTIRFKSRSGITASWRIGKNRDGKFKALGLSKARVGRDPIPLDFIPFELSNAVINGPAFDTIDQAEHFVRGL